MHNAHWLLKNSIAMPKLLNILRTSPCANNPLLQVFDMKLKEGLQTILNVELSDLQWKQASLPVQMGGLEVSSACMLAPSAFLASSAATLPLQEAILSSSLAGVEDKTVSIAKASWLNMSNTIEPLDSLKHIQRHGTPQLPQPPTILCSRRVLRLSIRQDSKRWSAHMQVIGYMLHPWQRLAWD